MSFDKFYTGADLRFYVENLDRIERLVRFKTDIEKSLPMSMAETVRNALQAMIEQGPAGSPLRPMRFDAYADFETYVMFSTPELWDREGDRGVAWGITDFTLKSLQRGSSKPLCLALWSNFNGLREHARWRRELFALADQLRPKIEKLGGRVGRNPGVDYAIEVPLPKLNFWQLRADPEAAMNEIVERAEALVTFVEPRLRAMNPLGLPRVANGRARRMGVVRARPDG